MKNRSVVTVENFLRGHIFLIEARYAFIARTDLTWKNSSLSKSMARRGVPFSQSVYWEWVLRENRWIRCGMVTAADLVEGEFQNRGKVVTRWAWTTKVASAVNKVFDL